MTIAQSHPQNNVGLDLSKLSVLVVDSDGYAVETVNQIMRGFGLKNQASAENGEAAKARLNQKAIDLFIVEAVLPDMLGAELVKWIRRHQDLMVRQSSIIVLTGHTVVKNIESARDCGANIVLKKPVAATTLFDRIAWCAATHRSFIETDTYVGPDRRFRQLGPPDGIGRRSTDLPAEIGAASEPNLLQSEIDSFIKPVKVQLD
jgi:DNA-binding response OmpR family regulator